MSHPVPEYRTDSTAPESMRSRFLDGLAAQVGLDAGTFAAPGITVVGRDDRAGTGIAACYRVDGHVVVWADPDVVAAVESSPGLTGPGDGPTPDDTKLADALRRAGFEHVDGGVMCTLRTQPAAAPVCPPPYLHRRLDAGAAADVHAIRTFIDRADPGEADLAGLADFGDYSEFDEIAINVIVDGTSDGSPIVAYSSAMDWDWDPVFADIAVLVDPAHRGKGLARQVTTATIHDILGLGRLPLYRYRADNVGSAHLATSLGFQPATTLTRHRRSA